jgi:hypothetical protein
LVGTLPVRTDHKSAAEHETVEQRPAEPEHDQPETVTAIQIVVDWKCGREGQDCVNNQLEPNDRL